jgi:predicted DNA-binding transcriptional regulator YafY
MPVDYTIKRYAFIVARIQQGKYPSLKVLESMLESNDLKVSTRTLQRDIENLRTYYGLELEYSHDHQGYFLREESNAIAHVFLRLLHLLHPGTVVLDALRKGGKLEYVHLGNDVAMSGIHQIQEIMQAIHGKKVIRFHHLNYVTEEQKRIELQPLLLKEYHERWYVYGYAPNIGEYRTYGIDRISDIEITGSSFLPDPLHNAAERFNDQIGVTMADGELEEVVIRFSPLQARYVKSLPWHHSQELLQEDASGSVIRWHLKVNFELLQNILQCGEEVEVIQPAALRAELIRTLQSALGKYQ